MLSTVLRACAVLLASFALLVPAAFGQGYPAKPLTGGLSDVFARGVAQQLGPRPAGDAAAVVRIGPQT